MRLGPKRPPIAAGVRADGRASSAWCARPGIADAIRAVAPDLEVEEVDVAGPADVRRGARRRLGGGGGPAAPRWPTARMPCARRTAASAVAAIADDGTVCT